ncbi:response regulator [Anaerolineales bacterium]
MSKGHILVVDDDFDISNMLRIYFSGQDYSVGVANKGKEALEAVRKQLPNLIILDINLPDMSGYDVCRDLRTTIRTSHIPIIFLTGKDERSDKIVGLELGADDYITKPFDIEEVKLRAQNSIIAASRQSQIDSISNLPTGSLIEDHLRQLMRSPDSWTYIDTKIANFDMFTESYGWAAGDEVVRFLALLIGEVVDEIGTSEDFVGNPARENFIVISHIKDVKPLVEKLVDRFTEGVKQHYSFIDRERGYMTVTDNGEEKQVNLMTLNVGYVSTSTHQFSDIREITELAAENRRRNIGGDNVDNDNNASSILTAW